MTSPVEPKRPRSRGRRLLKIGLILLASLGLVFAGVATWTYFHVQNKFGETHRDIRVDPKPEKGEPVNVLVLGSDRRDVLDPELREERQYRGGSGQRADTIILIHVSGDGKNAVLLHFPRDLRVQIPGMGQRKLNAAYSGGPNLVVRTIREYTGLQIHHYVEVNFAAFRSFVNAVGGVDLCVNRSYSDPQSGLFVRRPGCYTFDGDRALSYVRARKVDPDGDYGRIRRQQQFIRILMDKITSIGFLLDLPRVVRLANAVGTGVVTDRELGLGTVRRIANSLGDFEQRSIDFRVVPSYPKLIGSIWYVVDRPPQARALFRALQRDTTLPPYGKTSLSVPEPRDVSITIRNASGDRDAGDREAARLRGLGFRVRRVQRVDAESRTTILFEPGAELKAQLVQEQFRGSAVRVSTDRLPTEVVVVLGRDASAAVAAAG